MKACLVIPIYDHERAIGGVVESLARFSLQCIIVDDGSHQETRRALSDLEERFDWVSVVRHASNLGKGAALRTAYRAAAELGMTHVVQLDADGQHDADDVPRFLAASLERPGTGWKRLVS
jgi:glycosyltransferase involved in cell wall biosynthesis